MISVVIGIILAYTFIFIVLLKDRHKIREKNLWKK